MGEEFVKVQSLSVNKKVPKLLGKLKKTQKNQGGGGFRTRGFFGGCRLLYMDVKSLQVNFLSGASNIYFSFYQFSHVCKFQRVFKQFKMLRGKKM